MTTASKLTDLHAIDGIELNEVLGVGSSSFVYRGTRDGKSYAVKVSKVRDEDGVLTPRFRTEAAILSQFRHPAFVETLAVGDVEKAPYAVIELVPGSTLADSAGQTAWDETAVAEFAIRLADALSVLHAR